MSTRLLYQFPISHYCEKARWCLDFKGLDYRVRNLLPGPHLLQARRLSGSSTVPILCDGGQRISDSRAIALYLEQTCPQPALLPAATRAEVLALAARYDAVGADVRRWLYAYLTRAPDFGRTFHAGYGWPLRWVGYALTPALRRVLPRVYAIRPDTVERSYQRLLASLDQLETDLRQDPARYLCGERFTLADLTAAALFAPLVCPPESPWPGDKLPPELLTLRQQLRQRVAGQWILRMYREHRRQRMLTFH